MAAVTTDLSDIISDYPAGVHTSVGTAVTNNRVTIPISWSGLNGYPEIIVETAIEDVDASYIPAKVVEEYGITTPVKFRFPLEDGSEMLIIDSIFGTTPFVRVKIYAGAADEGTIIYNIDLG